MRSKIAKTAFFILLLSFIVYAMPLNAAYNSSRPTVGDELDYLEELKERKREQENEKAKTEEEYRQTSSEIYSLIQDIERLEQEIKKANEEIAKYEIDIEDKKEETDEILRFLQISNGEKSYLEYVFKATSFTDFIHRVSIVEQLSKYNKEQIDLMNDLIKKNNELKAKNAKDIKTNEKKQEELKNKLASLGKKIDEMDKTGLTIEEEIKAQEEWINTLNNSGCTNRSDKISECMGMPMISRFVKPFNTGYVSSDYYWRISPITGYLETHSGIDLSTYTPAEGTPIHPVGAGVIGAKIYYKDCGGNMLYIYHNVNGYLYTSVYMHLLNFNENFQVGDVVSENDVIGNMGGWSTSTSHGGYDYCTTGAHLHLTLAYGHTTNHRAYMFNPRNMINFPPENGWFYGRY